MREFAGLSKATTYMRVCRQVGPLFLLLFILTACTSNTGVFSGGSWQASGLQKQHIQALVADPNHLQDIYAGDAQAGVFVSTNAGVTWKAGSVGLPASLAVNALAFDTAGKKLYAATSVGLFVSSDSANSWSRVAGVPTDSYSALAFDVNTPQIVYVASAHSGVLMSRDDGMHWTSVSSSLSAGVLTSVLYDSNQKDLWAASANSIYRSSDNGATWRTMDGGLPANVGINTLAQGAVSGSSDLIFAGTNHGFFLSNDAGQHWAQSQFSLANLKVSSVLLDATQVAVVYASTDIGVLRSNDSGQTWGPVSSGLPNNQVFAGLVQGDANYAQLFVGGNGVYRYPGGGGTFEPSRILPAILILLFLFLLYYFFTVRRRRRRSARNPTPDEGTPVLSEEGEPEELPGGNSLNGHYPPAGSTPDVSEDEKQES
jgi:photosystem II stability/assembly factor-like uncharacterized protein